MRRPFNESEVKKAAEVVGGRVFLAKKINISYQTVSDWINGKKTPSPESCMKIEKATEGRIKAEDILFPYNPFKELKGH